MLFLNAFLAACIGAFVGKFMAIVIHYLPIVLLAEDEWEREPRDILRLCFQVPRCRRCHCSLRWPLNIPVLGYFLLRGECPYCLHQLRQQTFWIEFGASAFFGLTALFLPLSLPVWYSLLVGCLLFCCFMTDLEHGILPDQFTLSLVWIGLVGSLIPVFVNSHESIIGAVAGYGIFWLFNVFYRYFRRVEGMYPGDFKLNAGIGACVGMKSLIPILLTSLFLLIFAVACQLIYSINYKKRYKENFLYKEVAYGCYASLVAFLFIYLKLIGIF